MTHGRRPVRPVRGACRARRVAVAVVACGLLATACGGRDGAAAGSDAASGPDAAAGPDAASDAPDADADRVAGEVSVFAAASLSEASEELARRFEAAHPGVSVRLQLAGSQTLATQLAEGAAADVFVSADERQMARVVRAVGVRSGPVEVARNRLALAVPAGNPAGVTGLADLARPDVAVVLAAEEVPAGRYARAALGAAGVTVTPVSLESDVRGVLTRLVLGEADAGLLYASDLVAAGGRVADVADPALAAETSYPAAVPASAANPAAGRAFLAFLRSAPARAVLVDHGLLAP